MNYKFKLLTSAVFTVMSLLCNAQQNDTLEIQRNEKGKISFARFKPTIVKKNEDPLIFLKRVLNANADDQFLLIKDVTDKLKISHRKYQQYYKGIKVENAEYLIHGKNESIETINGDFLEVKISSITPSVNKQAALRQALKFVNAKKYKWEDTAFEAFIKKKSGNINATYYPNGELVITKDFIKGGNNLRLAWKFTISSLDPNNEQLIYIDATTNEVIRQTPLMYEANTPCTAATSYSGTVGITGDSYTGGYRLKENRNGVDVHTLNLQNTTNYANVIDFSNSNTSFTSGSWSGIGQHQKALDAHWALENVLDYWSQVHSRNSIDGSGLNVLSYVHYGVAVNNAYWDGTNNVMLYGDGDGAFIGGFTTLDICGHEMGHGITQYTAALSPGTQESGALNEGFSDIWGACVEHFGDPTKQTWLIAEEIFATAAYSGIRNMQNPKSTSAYEGQHPNTYNGQFWDANGEPHNNSTVLSHWFYLLSQGGTGTNDLSNAYAVTGVGIHDAELIAFRAESVYLNSSANYAAARNTTIQAAQDLFGAGSCQEIAVTNAWYAVGVGAQFAMAISSSSANFCTSGSGVSGNYTITNLPAGATVHWDISPSSGIATINSPNSTQTTLTRNNDGYVTLTATVSSSCGNFVLHSQYIYVGGGNYSIFIGGFDNPAYTGAQQYLYVDYVPNATYEWTVTSAPYPDSYAFDGNGLGQVSFYAYYPGSYSLQVKITTPCYVYYAYGSVEVHYPWDNYMYTMAPNPVSTTVTVTQSENSKKQKNIKEEDMSIKMIRVFDNFGNLKKQIPYGAGTRQAQVNVSDLKTGIYYIEISNTQSKERQQIIVQK